MCSSIRSAIDCQEGLGRCERLGRGTSEWCRTIRSRRKQFSLRVIVSSLLASLPGATCRPRTWSLWARGRLLAHGARSFGAGGLPSGKCMPTTSRFESSCDTLVREESESDCAWRPARTAVLSRSSHSASSTTTQWVISQRGHRQLKEWASSRSGLSGLETASRQCTSCGRSHRRRRSAKISGSGSTTAPIRMGRWFSLPSLNGT